MKTVTVDNKTYAIYDVADLTHNCATCNNRVAARTPYLYQQMVKHGVLCGECRHKIRWSQRTYGEYLKSAHWAQFRARAIKHYARKCYLCGVDNKPLELHHNDYTRLGDERLSDVIPLCANCHQNHHGIGELEY